MGLPVAFFVLLLLQWATENKINYSAS